MTENVAETPAGPRPASPQRLQFVVLGVAVAAAALVVVWLILGGNSRAQTPGLNSGPTVVSQAQLEQFAEKVDHPVYWAGPKAGFSYELTSASGRVWVRYLPAGVKAGDPRADLLVVGTYGQPHSFANLQRAAKRPDAVTRTIGTDGLVVFNSKKPTSVYFGYPDAKYQVEVYAASGQAASGLVLTGAVKPIH